MNNINIAIAEDNFRLARGISEKLSSYSETINICFHESNGNLLIEHLTKEPEIDLILMDIEMPELGGIDTTAQVRNLFPKIKIVMLTVFDDDDKILQSIQAGASGYLLKDISAQKLYESILMIMDGGAPMSPTVAFKTLKMIRATDLEIKNSAESKKVLTNRETEILEHICEGLNYKQIAEQLFIAPTTVRKHIANIYDKLHVRNKVQAIAKAQRERLI